MTSQTFQSPFELNHVGAIIDAVNLAAQADRRHQNAETAQGPRQRRPRGRSLATLAGVLLAAGATLIAVMAA